MRQLEAEISRIGSEVVVCGRGCDGVFSQPEAGVIPRGLTLDLRDVASPGAIFRGMNPGEGDDAERRAFKNDGPVSIHHPDC